MELKKQNKHIPGRSSPPVSAPDYPICASAPRCRPQSWLPLRGSSAVLSRPVLHQTAGPESFSSFPCLPLISTHADKMWRAALHLIFKYSGGHWKTVHGSLTANCRTLVFISAGSLKLLVWTSLRASSFAANHSLNRLWRWGQRVDSIS